MTSTYRLKREDPCTIFFITNCPHLCLLTKPLWSHQSTEISLYCPFLVLPSVFDPNHFATSPFLSLPTFSIVCPCQCHLTSLFFNISILFLLIFSPIITTHTQAYIISCLDLLKHLQLYSMLCVAPPICSTFCSYSFLNFDSTLIISQLFLQLFHCSPLFLEGN